MENKLVCIVLPMLNEEKAFDSVRTMFDNRLKLPASWDYMIVVVDDGSTDHTRALAEQWEEDNTHVRVMVHPENKGLGEAILTGFKEAVKIGADAIVTLDGDGSHPVETIYELVLAIGSNADIAIASRFAPGSRQKGVPFYRNIFSLGARMLLQAVFPLRGVRDYTCGFRAYKTSVVRKTMSQAANNFIIFNTFTAMAEILLKVAVNAGNITEVPLFLRYDLKYSPTKLKTGPTIRDYFRLCLLPKQNCALGRGLHP